MELTATSPDPYGVYTNKWLYLAQERQEALHRSSSKNVLYGGAAGGGKSHGGRWHGIMACLRHPNFQVLLLRRTYPELEKTHIIEIQRELPRELGAWKASVKRIEFPNGSLMQFGHCERDQDVKQYLSTEWGMILIDEASTFNPWPLRMLASRLRTTDPNVNPQMVYLTNPGGPAHMFLRERFLDRYVDPEDDPTYVSEDYEFIPAFVQDNKYVNEDYVNRLMALPPAEREAYLYGNWDAFAGQYFPEFNQAIHGVEVQEQFEIPEFWERFGCMDWGYSPSPGVVYWNAIDQHERIWTYKELLFKQSAPVEVARMIHGRTEDMQEDRMIIFGDTQMWTAQPDKGVSIADEINDVLAELGSQVVLLPANKDRINGWARMHQYLMPDRMLPDDTEGPYWRIFKHNELNARGCPYLLKTIPAQVHKEDQSGDMEKGSSDHGCDAMRYGLMSRPPLTMLPAHMKEAPSHNQRIAARTRQLMAKFQQRQDVQLYERPDMVLATEIMDEETAAELWS